MPRLLLIEPDRQLASVLESYLSEHNLLVSVAYNRKQAIENISQQPFEIVVMELCLPDAQGVELIQDYGAFLTLPLLVLTQKDDPKIRVEVLQLGARDVLVKPFNLQELLLRINNIIDYQVNPTKPSRIRIGAFLLDKDNKVLINQDKAINLTVNEYRLLTSLMRKPGKVYSRSELVDNMADFGGPESQRAVDITVSRLRKKLEQDPKKPQVLITVTGFGYKLRA